MTPDELTEPPTKDARGAVVELVLDGQQVLRRVDAQVGALGEVVAQQAVGVSFEPRCHGEWESQK